MSVQVQATTGDRIRRWRPTRRTVALVVLLVVAGAVLVSQVPRRTGYLDPTAVDPQGSRAVTTILADLGVQVAGTTSLDATVASATGATVLVTEPALVSPRMVTRLLSARPANLVLVSPVPGEALHDRLAAGVGLAGSGGGDPVDPGCTLRAATRAGSASLPGLRYDAQAWTTAQACYDRPAESALVALPARGSTPPVFLLGSSTPLTNDGLDDEGNAALALDLLGGTPQLVWWQPSPADPALADSGGAPVSQLVPAWVAPVLAQLLVAALVAVWWRGRRLGPLAVEDLPVVVRAGETTGGRARLLRANRARGEAARHLRERAREQARVRLGLPPGCLAERVVSAVAARTGRHPEGVSALLYGQDPVGDAQLVALSRELEALVREVGGA